MSGAPPEIDRVEPPQSRSTPRRRSANARDALRADRLTLGLEGAHDRAQTIGAWLAAGRARRAAIRGATRKPITSSRGSRRR